MLSQIWTDHDFVRVEHAFETYNLIPNAEFAVIPDAGHFALFSERNRVIPVIANFLKKPEKKIPIATAENGYRDAVKAASSGNIAESFDGLDRIGCIREVAPDDRRALLAREYRAEALFRPKGLQGIALGGRKTKRRVSSPFSGQGRGQN